MDLNIENRKGGKSLITFDCNKYRESYSRKNGETVWKCLGRTCNASVVTNAARDQISVKGSHQGRHPATMCNLTGTPPSKPTLSTPGGVSERSYLSSSLPLTQRPLDVASPPPASTPVAFEQSSATVIQHDVVETLQTENQRLSFELKDARTQNKILLDHSIESDMRLLHYTSDVFSAKPYHPPSSSPNSIPTLVSQTTQTDSSDIFSIEETVLKSDLNKALEKIKQLEIEIGLLRKPCPTCQVLREEASNMVTAIRCLEEQLRSAQRLQGSSELQPSCNKDNSTIYPHLLPVHNRFKPLDSEEPCRENDEFTLVRRNKKRRSKTHRPNKSNTAPSNNNIKNIAAPRPSPLSLPFKEVTILGDSHARHLAAMVRDLITSDTKITGVCKPGAGLLNVTTSSAPRTADHVSVLLAGSNDVNSGNHQVIFEQMEATIRKFPKVIVSTLPHRYDLAPQHPVNRTIEVVNSYIAELCSRYAGATLLDISCIPRREFTSHGMHLRACGKRHLTRMIAVTLLGLTSSANPHAPECSVDDEAISAVRGAVSVDHASYADALRHSPLSRRVPAVQSLECINKSRFFLENAALASGPV